MLRTALTCFAVLCFLDANMQSLYAEALPSRLQQAFRADIHPVIVGGDSNWTDQERIRLMRGLANIAARVRAHQLPVVDRLLEGYQQPSFAHLLTFRRMASDDEFRHLGARSRNRVPEISNGEVLLSLQFIADRIDDLKANPIIAKAEQQKPLEVESIREYEQAFWELHVFDNQLALELRLAQFANEKLEPVESRIPRNQLPADKQKLLDLDFAELSSWLVDTRNQLRQYDATLRKQRFTDAEILLKDSKAVFIDRLHATFAIQLDAGILKQYATIDEIANDSAFDNEFVADVDEKSETALKNAKDITEKSELFFRGLHWWIRGRYGMGPLMNGLLKQRAALDSDKAMFALFMPKETPKPTDPMSGGLQVPTYARRHDFIWALEDRQLLMKEQLKQYGKLKGASFKSTHFY